MKLDIYLLIFSLFTLYSCGNSQGNDRLSEKAYIEALSGAQGQTQAQQINAVQMELDLEERFKIIESLSGVFEGVVLTDQASSYLVRMITTSNIPRPAQNRKRMPDEVINDLNKLSMNVQILMWRESTPQGAIGCLATNTTPNYKAKQLIIATDQCPGMYFITGSTEVDVNNHVVGLTVKFQPTANSKQLNIKLNRVE